MYLKVICSRHNLWTCVHAGHIHVGRGQKGQRTEKARAEARKGKSRGEDRQAAHSLSLFFDSTLAPAFI